VLAYFPHAAFAYPNMPLRLVRQNQATDVSSSSDFHVVSVSYKVVETVVVMVVAEGLTQVVVVVVGGKLMVDGNIEVDVVVEVEDSVVMY